MSKGHPVQVAFSFVGKQAIHKQQTKLTSNLQATCHNLCAIGGYSPTDLIHLNNYGQC
nr:MAG TPA: hypothetical protein [Caudoviricetes sp.]